MDIPSTGTDKTTQELEIERVEWELVMERDYLSGLRSQIERQIHRVESVRRELEELRNAIC